MLYIYCKKPSSVGVLLEIWVLVRLNHNRGGPETKPTWVRPNPSPSYYHAFPFRKNKRKMAPVPRRSSLVKCQEMGVVGGAPLPGWPSEAFVAGSVPLVAKINWTSSWAHQRVKRSRNGWAKPKWIIHRNRLTFLMKASLLEVQHKLLVKYITSATATSIPVPTAQAPISISAPTFESMRLCRHVSS